MTDENAAILRTESLTRKFGEFLAVDSMTIDVQEGEVFGLLGRNAAGKTTVLKMLTTLLRPTSGRATIGGYDLVRQAASVRRVIGYVPQALSADGDLTGFENLLIFARLYDLPRALRNARIQESLDFMGLGAFGDKLVKTYSGGMIRRLEIAQSTLHRPRVLFLDEPTVGLDPVARSSVWAQLEKLRTRYGSTILLTTHYLDEAEQLCNRVAVMNAGRVTAMGTPADLRRALGKTATLEDVFEHYTGGDRAVHGAYDETSQTRHSMHRLG